MIPPTWKSLAPGVYDDGEGGVHIMAEEICAHFGVAPTDENFEVVQAGVRKARAELGMSDVPVEVVA